ncbi:MULTISPECIES: hypothetical protein [unclassified Variovorax]|uniref:hypothetical protein n=1 Tax=unclassified Variovorax TaxID=663243 RepID=UPI00076C0C51|nr:MULTISPECIES: hypothetical protein [unclassified Variovorax]KWT98083.1 hypothetical protein APY03_0754 [Variovorax sp. WDL1]PNG50443.1 hypothetical protein CHC06_06067 [Variovorax sp. B2]PNG51316.1 hypothetical protein CHC07_05973 [Variovorax sp. B4]VTU43281.1 hypothetical protein H6P1_00407 [Variovorax sp. PBL-H6]VTU43317.1 hypothetical protein SRS16P1_00498 [Variovorax sp. SRS16]
MSTITINASQRLFVLPSGRGFSCLGFDVTFKRLRQFASLLGLASPNEADIGTLAQYQLYEAAQSAYIATKPTTTLFDPDTPVKVQAVLEAYRQHGGRLRLFMGDALTGRDWLEEHDVIGTVGRSMGPIRAPLLISRRNSHGGGAILTACIVRIIDVASKQELYRHPAYRVPNLVRHASKEPGYAASVSVDGELQASFKSDAKADKWIAFMQGHRMTPN